MIQIENLVKNYGPRRAIDNLTLRVAKGEVFGLLGPNGAGKTTIIRILTMLTQPDAGSVRINNRSITGERQAIKSVIGVVPQHFNLDVDLTARENLELHGRLHHLPKDFRRRRMEELLEFVELEDRGHDMVGSFSGGMKRRLMIARALLHCPQILFLDEPTVGLDPQVRRRLWDLIRRLHGEGLTVMLTTHYIEEAENLSQRVAILNSGRLIALDQPAELCNKSGRYVVEWVDEDCTTQNRFFFTREEAGQFAGTLAHTAIIRRSNLEDVFVQLTGKKVQPDV